MGQPAQGIETFIINDEAKAAEAFAEAYRLDRDKIEAIINYATVLHQRGQNQQSADAFARARARPTFLVSH